MLSHKDGEKISGSMWRITRYQAYAYLIASRPQSLTPNIWTDMVKIVSRTGEAEPSGCRNIISATWEFEADRDRKLLWKASYVP